MAINWFPGHMVAAQKKAAEALADIDVVIEVLDARSPAATVNPMINAMREARQRPALKILNKIDVADPAVTEAWLRWFNAQDGVHAIGLSCKKAGESARFEVLLVRRRGMMLQVTEGRAEVKLK